MILELREFKEYRQNGSLWIVGEIGIVAEMWMHLYDFRLGFKGLEGKPVCRIGIWTKYYSNGEKAWELDFKDGKLK